MKRTTKQLKLENYTMKRIDNTAVWTDGTVKYTKNAQGDFVIYVEEEEDNWTYSDRDFVTLDEPVVLKPNDEHDD